MKGEGQHNIVGGAVKCYLIVLASCLLFLIKNHTDAGGFYLKRIPQIECGANKDKKNNGNRVMHIPTAIRKNLAKAIFSTVEICITLTPLKPY